MEKIVNKLINEFTIGTDKYTKDGSTWLIFTDTKKWVIELTKEGTLWYNYNFFKNLFLHVSLDVVDNQKYITKWVEDNVINNVRDVAENGVKYTTFNGATKVLKVEDTIENGVKHTRFWAHQLTQMVEDTLQNGIKLTKGKITHLDILVNNAGVFMPGKLSEERDHDYELQMALNVSAASTRLRRLLELKL